MKNITIHVDCRLKKVIKRDIIDTEVVINPTPTSVHCCAKAAPGMKEYWCGDCVVGRYDKCFYRSFGSDTVL